VIVLLPDRSFVGTKLTRNSSRAHSAEVSISTFTAILRCVLRTDDPLILALDRVAKPLDCALKGRAARAGGTGCGHGAGSTMTAEPVRSSGARSYSWMTTTTARFDRSRTLLTVATSGEFSPFAWIMTRVGTMPAPTR
jgi:hypothetical protein